RVVSFNFDHGFSREIICNPVFHLLNSARMSFTDRGNPVTDSDRTGLKLFSTDSRAVLGEQRLRWWALASDKSESNLRYSQSMSRSSRVLYWAPRIRRFSRAKYARTI